MALQSVTCLKYLNFLPLRYSSRMTVRRGMRSQHPLALLLSHLVFVVPPESCNRAAVTKDIHFRNMFFHVSKERSRAWEEMRSFFSVGYLLPCNILAFFRLLSEFKELVDIYYYYSLYCGWTCSYCKQLALQLNYQPSNRLTTFSPESKSEIVAELCLGLVLKLSVVSIQEN